MWLQKFSVPYEYPVYFTADVFSPANHDLLAAVGRREPLRRHRLLFVVETALTEKWPRLLGDAAAYVAHHADRLQLAAAPLVIAGGEASKNDAVLLAHVQERIHAAAIDRQSFVVAVGGGALQDMVGYAATTVHRGVRVIRVPTTVLAQNDSGVGVKNGVNAFATKNFFGTFAPPFAVLNDRRFLETLERRDTIAGMAEAVKVALIRDAAFFAWLVDHAPALADREPAALGHLVRRCAELHLEHIATSGDPFEFGSARPLDFGHWAAHKLETLTGHRLRHGEAVAIGIALDSIYSVRSGLLAEAALKPILSLLERLGFRLWDDAMQDPALLDGLAEFREHLGGELTITLLKDIGRGVEVNEMSRELILTSVDDLHRRTAAR